MKDIYVKKSPAKVSLNVVLCLVFALLSASSAMERSGFFGVLLWLGALFFATAAIGLAIYLATGSKALAITAEGILNRTTISARSSALIPWEAVGGVSNEPGGIKIHPSSHADAERYITPRNQAIMTQHLTLPSGMNKRDLIQAIEGYRDSAHGEAKVAAIDTSR